MNLALIIERFDPAAGGAEQSCAQMAAELLARGHRVTVLAGSATGHLDEQRFPRSHFTVDAWALHKPRGAWGLWRFNRWVQRRLDQERFDVSLSVVLAVPANVLEPRSGTTPEAIAQSVARRRTPLKRLAKRLAANLSPKQRLLLAMEARSAASPRVKRFVAISRYMARQLEHHYGIGPSRIDLAPNAAAMPEIKAQQRRHWRCGLRESLGIGTDTVAYLYAANDPWRKGLPTLFGAARILKDQGLDFVVMLAGKSQYRHQAWAAELGIRENLRLLGPTRHMAALYCAADVTVLPTFYDPASKVVIESLMMGTPAISTRFDGSSDFIIPPQGRSRGRVLSNPADSAALAQAMLELADPDERARCAAATANLGPSLSMARHVDQLESVLAQAARSLRLDKPDSHAQAATMPAGE